MKTGTKKNAALIAGIMFVAAGCASQGGYGRAGMDSGYSSGYADSTARGNEIVDRNAQGHMQTHVPMDATLSHNYDVNAAASASIPEFDADADHEITVNDSSREVDLSNRNARATWGNSEIRADSSIRGGSPEARGSRQWSSTDMESSSGHEMDRRFRADSSERGTSLEARGHREWSTATESGAGAEIDEKFKADSSIRGGSPEARGFRSHGLPSDGEASVGGAVDFESGSDTSADSGDYDFEAQSDLDDRHMDQDQSSTSIDRSANWGDDSFDPSNSFDQDGIESDNGSLSGAANIYSNPGSESVVQGNLYNSTDLEGRSGFSGAAIDSGSSSELNSSPRLEENLSGEFNLDERQDTASITSPSGESSLKSTGDKHGEMEGVGGPASSQSESSSSSSDNSDVTIQRDSFTADVGPDGSQSSGAPATTESESFQGHQDGDLAERVKATLVRESTGTHGLMRHQVARNITVSSHGGLVTLKGSVPSEQDKQIIEIRAREVKGVTSVKNELTVSPDSNPANRDLSEGHDLEERTDQLKD